MTKDIDQTPAARRDRGVGEDRGQHGALHSGDRTQPNKSALGAKDAPAQGDLGLGDGTRPDVDRGDAKNLGR